MNKLQNLIKKLKGTADGLYEIRNEHLNRNVFIGVPNVRRQCLRISQPLLLTYVDKIIKSAYLCVRG